MNTAPTFRSVCQLTGTITHPETSDADAPRSAPDQWPALETPPAGAGHYHPN